MKHGGAATISRKLHPYICCAARQLKDVEQHTSEMQDPLLWQRSSDVKARDLVVTMV